MNTKKDEELRLLFQTYIEDIRYSKKQQWNTIYLTLIGIGGIITLFLGLKSSQILSRCIFQFLTIKQFLIGLSILIPSLGIFYLSIYHKSIKRYRRIKEGIKDTFTPEAKKITNVKKYFCEEHDDICITLAFCILISIAGLLSLFILW